MAIHQWLAEWSSWGWPLLANHLWQATLICIFAFAAGAALRSVPGRARYALWLIASAKFVLPSVLVFSIASSLGVDFSPLLISPDGSNDGAKVFFQLTAPVGTAIEPAFTGQAPRGHDEWFCVLTLVWLAGSTSLVSLWLARRRRFRRAIRATILSDPPRERQALDRVKSWMTIKRDIRLSVLPGTVEPGVWGVWRPRVFLPQRMAEELSDAELEAVMMHEIIHVERRDNLIANAHRLICCLLWFHPFVWILDRLMLAERERACDEEVIRLGGAADVYASSLLKVLRFCLGWSVAGASNVTGSNLGRRVERIMSKNNNFKLSVWHRMAIGSVVAVVLVSSLAAGLLNRQAVVAQSTGTRQRVPGGVPGGAPGGISEWASPSGDPDGQENLLNRLDQFPEVQIEFRNSARTPLLITEAKVRAVPREKGPGDEFAVVPVITVTNTGERRIKGFTLEFRTALERRAYFERLVAGLLEPNGTYTTGRQRRVMTLVGRPDGWTVRVSGVIFQDGEVWGAMPPPPPPPPLPPAEIEALERAPEIAARFNNRDGAPLSITGATLKSAKLDGVAGDSNPDRGERHLIRLSVTVVNNTARRFNGLAIEFGSPESKIFRTYASVRIEPHAQYTLVAPRSDTGYATVFVRGNLDQNEVRVIGASFEDGETWGDFPPPPPPPPPPLARVPPPLNSGATEGKLIRKSSGVFAGSATHRVMPDTPPLAQAARITGSVVVEVNLDEAGVVISARAISGHPLLKDAAVNAARQWQFSPTLLSGVPVRVVGTLTFNFEP